MQITLLVVSLIIIACIVANKITNRIGVPMLLAFILLGMLFGSDGIFKIDFGNFIFAEKICSIALVFIIFYGGFSTNWTKAKNVAVKSILLSSVGVIITAFLTGLFCYYILKFELLESMLIGAVLSSTDAASVFGILRSQKLNLKYSTASMLELESGSNDPWAYMLTIIILSIMSNSSTTSSIGSIIYMIFAQIVFGVIFALVVAAFAYWTLNNFDFESAGFDAIFVVAIAILSFALPSVLGGNGYLSAYIVGIILGNKKIINKKPLVHFFDGLTGLMQILIFFLLGLLAFPSQIPKVLLPSIAIALFLTLIARPLATFSVLMPFKAKIPQQLLVSFAGLRGATSIVFAIMATVSDAYTDNDVFHIVFLIVLISIGVQGSLLPLVSKKLNMIDDNENVLKTFNDYSEETEVQFIRLPISEGHSWIGKKVKEITLPLNTLIVIIKRSGEQLIPNGDTVIVKDDVLILSAMSYSDDNSINLSEILIDETHLWCGKRISEIELSKDTLVVVIKRNNKALIPNGNIKIKNNDILVLTSKNSKGAFHSKLL